MAEQPGADLAEALPGDRRHGEGGIAKARDLQERPQLGVRLGEALHLVCEEERGESQRVGVLFILRGDAGGLAGRLPAIGEGHAALAQDGVDCIDLFEARGVAEIHNQQRRVRRVLASHGTGRSGERAGRSTS